MFMTRLTSAWKMKETTKVKASKHTLICNTSIRCIYRVIHKSLRNFRTRLRNNQDRQSRKEHIKNSVSLNLPKLSQLWWCKEGFRPYTTQNHLWTKQFVIGTWNSSRVTACTLQNEQAGWGHWPRLSNMCEKRLSGAWYVTKDGHAKHL
jgi:hypothetical protein